MDISPFTKAQYDKIRRHYKMTKCVFFVIASELCERGNLQRKFMDCHAVFVKTARNDEFIVELSVSEVSINSIKAR